MTADHFNAMMPAFANMIQHQQTHNQDMFATVMRAVGTGKQAEERALRGILGKYDLHRTKECHDNACEQCSCISKCAGTRSSN